MCRNIIILFITSLLLISCNKKESPQIKTINLESVKNVSFASLVDNINIIPLQTSSECLIGDNPRVICQDNFNYVIDMHGSQYIYRFNKTGEFINKIGNIGRASNEYISISSTCIVKDSIYILSGDFNVYHYLNNGTFVGRNKLNYNVDSFIKIKDHYWNYTGYNNGVFAERLALSNQNLDIEQKFLPIDTKVIHMKDQNSFYKSNNEIFLKESLNNIVYKIENTLVKPYLKFDFKNLNVPKKYFLFNDPFKAFDFLNKKGFISIYKYMESDGNSFVELNKQENNISSRILGFSQKNKWSWINLSSHDKDMFKGVFQFIKKGNILTGIMSANSIISLYNENPNIFLNKSVLKNIKRSDNPFIISVKLKNI